MVNTKFKEKHKSKLNPALLKLVEYIKSYRKIRENLLENRDHNNLRGEVDKRNSPCGEAERNS